MKPAFVIQSIGPQASDTRERADRVFNQLIQPACEQTGYQATRADKLSQRTIIEPIVSSLFTTPLVIADIGREPWNANVLTEIGFRIATGRAMLLLSDDEPTPDVLPLHLQNRRIQKIDSDDPSESDKERLVEAIRSAKTDISGWQSDYPIVEMRVPLNDPGSSRYFSANAAAVRVFGLDDIDGIQGQLVLGVDKNLQQYMGPKHWEAFCRDQDVLFGAITRPGRNEAIIADIPMWFQRHRFPDLNGRVYWPIVVQNKFETENQNALVLRVAFIDISKWIPASARRNNQNTVMRLPNAYQDTPPPSPKYDVFLSYNSRDRGYVGKLDYGLHHLSLNVWFDQHDLDCTHGLSTTLTRAMSQSRVFATIIGANGMGDWQKLELDYYLAKQFRGKGTLLVLLSPELSGRDRWQDYVDDKYADDLADVLHLPLPPEEELDEMIRRLTSGSPHSLAERIIQLFVKLLRP